MLWFFKRGQAQLRCEIRQALDRPGFELVCTSPDDQVHLEYAREPADLTTRRDELEKRLHNDGWKRLDRETP